MKLKPEVDLYEFSHLTFINMPLKIHNVFLKKLLPEISCLSSASSYNIINMPLKIQYVFLTKTFFNENRFA